MQSAQQFGRKLVVALVFLGVQLLSISPVFSQGNGASIYLSPAQGNFEVGSTFNISFFVDTGGVDINAVRLDVSFPPDKVQVSEPSVGNSFVSIWVEQPEYSNTSGIISLQGGLPSPGINTSAGLISTVTFRAKAPGRAVISVLDTSRVLANDGQGTDVLTSRGSGIIEVSIPAPEGPVVISRSHGDMNRWYRDRNVSLSWSVSGVDEVLEDQLVEYSWDFNGDALFIPDNTPEGSDTSIQYEDVENGVWYFHIKARMGGEWGSTTHMPVMIDYEKPAEFSPKVDPKVGSRDEKRIVTFLTSDSHSGIDHYELRIESLSDPAVTEFFFVEELSPYTVPELPDGVYEVTIRAFDRAGNYRDGVAEFDINTSFFRIVRGYVMFGDYSFRGVDFAVASVIFLAILLVVILLIRRRYRMVRRRNPVTVSEREGLGTVPKSSGGASESYTPENTSKESTNVIP